MTIRKIIDASLQTQAVEGSEQEGLEVTVMDDVKSFDETGREVSLESDGIFVITCDADEKAFEDKLIKESGKTRQEWLMETDPDDPPFKPGDKVWVDSMAGGIPNEMIPRVREPQTVEHLMPIPCSDGPLWSVDLVDIPYIFSQTDLRKA